MNMGIKRAATAVIGAAAIGMAALGSASIAAADPDWNGGHDGHGPGFNQGPPGGPGHGPNQGGHHYHLGDWNKGHAWDGPGYHAIQDWELRYPSFPGDNYPPPGYVPFGPPWDLVFVPAPPPGMSIVPFNGTLYWVAPWAKVGW